MHISFTRETKGKGSTDLDEGIKSLLLVVLRDDFCQELVFALGQFDKGTHTVNVGIDLDVEHIIPPCKGKMSLRENQIHTELSALLPPGPLITQRARGSPSTGGSGSVPVLL